MEQEDHSDDGDEHLDDLHGLACMGHAEEDAEYVNGQQRDDHDLDGLDHDILELVSESLEVRGAEKGHAQAEGEGEDE